MKKGKNNAINASGHPKAWLLTSIFVLLLSALISSQNPNQSLHFKSWSIDASSDSASPIQTQEDQPELIHTLKLHCSQPKTTEKSFVIEQLTYQLAVNLNAIRAPPFQS